VSNVEQVDIRAEDDGVRLDKWLKKRYPGLTQGRVEKLLRTGQVRVDGGRVKSNARLEAGQMVRVPPLGDLSPPPAKPKPKTTPQDRAYVQELVRHKDSSLIVINKPAGLAVQGGSKTERHLDGMLEGLKFDAPERPKLVHRLDRDTSGVLVLARNSKAAAYLGRAFKKKDAHKIYWALTVGVPRPAQGTIRMPLAKLGGPGRERVHAAEFEDEEAKNATTHFAVVAQAGQRLAWVAFMPVTGRTHQIRAHAAYALKTPIAGDGKYGGAEAHPGGEIERKLHLHARALDIAHPEGGRLKCTAPLPEHMLKAWKLLGFDPNDDGDPFAELLA
jgi:23S rRNA pseudouridine955/2504/2580 synthase